MRRIFPFILVLLIITFVSSTSSIGSNFTQLPPSSPGLSDLRFTSENNLFYANINFQTGIWKDIILDFQNEVIIWNTSDYHLSPMFEIPIPKIEQSYISNFTFVDNLTLWTLYDALGNLILTKNVGFLNLVIEELNYATNYWFFISPVLDSVFLIFANSFPEESILTIFSINTSAYQCFTISWFNTGFIQYVSDEEMILYYEYRDVSYSEFYTVGSFYRFSWEKGLEFLTSPASYEAFLLDPRSDRIIKYSRSSVVIELVGYDITQNISIETIDFQSALSSRPRNLQSNWNFLILAAPVLIIFSLSLTIHKKNRKK